MIGSYQREQTVSKQQEMFAIGVKRVALGIAVFVLSKYPVQIEQLPSHILRDFKILLSGGGAAITIIGLKSVYVGFQNANLQRRKVILIFGLGSIALGIAALATRAVIYIYEN